MPFPVRLLLAAALAAAAAPATAQTADVCEWKSPARDPFMGDVPSAVDHYRDIPAPTRERLKARMRKFAYDDIVTIRRDSIEGHYSYEPALLDMHFGNRRICGEVTRKTWKPEHEERGLAYCEDGQCVVVPLVCRNVSRILRRPGGGLTPGGGGAGPTGPAGPSTPAQPLSFDPPAAGEPPELEPTTRTPLGLVPAVPDTPTATLTPVPALPPPAPAPTAGGPPLVPLPAAPHLPPLAPPIPEPASLLLWAAGLAALTWRWRRRVGSD